MLANFIVFLSGLDDFDLSKYEARDIRFDVWDASITGTLHLPETENPPLALLVHGDGPQDRYSAGGYLPLIRTLLDNGIAVFSWDKPGVGSSTGNWLTHSMSDRAALAEVALATLRKQPDLKASVAGFVGFSQAGWVLPKLAAGDANAEAGFFVLVGAAINWQRQGTYFKKKRLQLEGLDEEAIEQALLEHHNMPTLQDGPDDIAEPHSMTPHRLGFVRRNMHSDSSSDLKHANAPFLIMHGDNDLNVDPDYNQDQYRALLGQRNPLNTYVLIEDATHGLLRSDLFNYQLPDEMPFWVEYVFMGLGRESYAPDALETLTSWINERTGQDESTR